MNSVTSTLTALACIAAALSHTMAEEVILVDPALRQRAIEESATPVREGVPFWNQNAVQFQFAPSFDFKPVPDAKTYRFSIQPAKGDALTFTADKPSASLAPIWTRLSTGKAVLTVRGLDANGHEVSEAMTRSFHLAAYRATNDPLHLAKAKALASTLTLTQSNPKAPGRYQTWLMQNPGPMWFNCELIAVRAMRELATAQSSSH